MKRPKEIKRKQQESQKPRAEMPKIGRVGVNAEEAKLRISRQLFYLQKSGNLPSRSERSALENAV